MHQQPQTSYPKKNMHLDDGTLAFSLLKTIKMKLCGEFYNTNLFRFFLSVYIEPTTNETDIPQRSLIPNAQTARKMLSPRLPATQQLLPLPRPLLSTIVAKQHVPNSSSRTVAKQRHRCVNKRCAINKVVMFWLENRLDDMVEIREQKCRMQAMILKGGETAKFGISVAASPSNHSVSEPIQLEAFRFVQPDGAQLQDKAIGQLNKKLSLNGVSVLSVPLAESFDSMEHIVIDETTKNNNNNGGDISSKQDQTTDPATAESSGSKTNDETKEPDSSEPTTDNPESGGDTLKSELVIDNTAQHHAVKIIDLSGNIEQITIPSAKKRTVPISTATVTNGKSLKLEASSVDEQEIILLNGQEILELVLNSKQSEYKIKVSVPSASSTGDGTTEDPSTNPEDSTSSKTNENNQNTNDGTGDSPKATNNNEQQVTGNTSDLKPSNKNEEGEGSPTETSIGGMVVTPPPSPQGKSGSTSAKAGSGTGVKVQCKHDENGRNMIMLAMNNTLDHPIAVVETINNLEPIIVPPHTTCKVGFAIQGTEFLILTGILMEEGKNKSILLNGEDNLSVQIKTNPDEFRDIKVTGKDVDYNADHVSTPFDQESFKNGPAVSYKPVAGKIESAPIAMTTQKPSNENEQDSAVTTTTPKPVVNNEKDSLITTTTTAKLEAGKMENSVETTTTSPKPIAEKEQASTITTTTTPKPISENEKSSDLTTTSKPSTENGKGSTTTTAKPTSENKQDSVTTTTTSKPSSQNEQGSAVTTTTTPKPRNDKEQDSEKTTTTAKPSIENEPASKLTTTITPKLIPEVIENLVKTTTTTPKPTVEKMENFTVATTTTSTPSAKNEKDSSTTTTTTPIPIAEVDGNSAVTTTTTPKPSSENEKTTTEMPTTVKGEDSEVAKITATDSKTENEKVGTTITTPLAKTKEESLLTTTTITTTKPETEKGENLLTTSTPTTTPTPTIEKEKSSTVTTTTTTKLKTEDENSVIATTTTPKPTNENDQKQKSNENNDNVGATTTTPKPTQTTTVAIPTTNNNKHKPTTNTTTKVTIKQNNNTIANYTKIECIKDGNGKIVNKVECSKNNDNSNSHGNDHNNTPNKDGDNTPVKPKAKVAGTNSSSQGDLGDTVSEISKGRLFTKYDKFKVPQF